MEFGKNNVNVKIEVQFVIFRGLHSPKRII